MTDKQITKIYESKILHDYKDGKIDFKEVAKFLKTIKTAN
jgi:hypothetical protein